MRHWDCTKISNLKVLWIRIMEWKWVWTSHRFVNILNANSLNTWTLSSQFSKYTQTYLLPSFLSGPVAYRKSLWSDLYGIIRMKSWIKEIQYTTNIQSLPNRLNSITNKWGRVGINTRTSIFDFKWAYFSRKSN